VSRPDRAHGPIVVGLDESAGGRAALRFALEEGLARGVTVEVVTTWILDMTLRERITDQMIADEAHVVRLRQDRVIAEVGRSLPELPAISQLVLHDAGGAPLVHASEHAAMLVVGSGRKRAVDRMLLGSVSEYCVRHARVPVVVVPDPSRVGGRVPTQALSSPAADSQETGTTQSSIVPLPS
jgi:nucleotide-binding universal stress UspA family protein